MKNNWTEHEDDIFSIQAGECIVQIEPEYDYYVARIYKDNILEMYFDASFETVDEAKEYIENSMKCLGISL